MNNLWTKHRLNKIIIIDKQFLSIQIRFLWYWISIIISSRKSIPQYSVRPGTNRLIQLFSGGKNENRFYSSNGRKTISLHSQIVTRNNANIIHSYANGKIVLVSCSCVLSSLLLLWLLLLLHHHYHYLELNAI